MRVVNGYDEAGSLSVIYPKRSVNDQSMHSERIRSFASHEALRNITDASQSRGFLEVSSRDTTAEWVCDGKIKTGFSPYLGMTCAVALSEYFAQLGTEECKVNILPDLTPINAYETFFTKL